MHILFNAPVNSRSVGVAQSLLASANTHPEATATIYLTTPGGENAAGIGFYHFLKILQFPVHIHAMGMCASGGVPWLLAAKRRTCAPGTHFMIHGTNQAGELSPQVGMMRDLFAIELGWTEQLDQYFSDISEKWFDTQAAINLGFVECVENVSVPLGEQLHVVPTG